MVVGEEELHRLEPGFRRGLEPVEKGMLIEHHRQVRTEARHGRILVRVGIGQVAG